MKHFFLGVLTVLVILGIAVGSYFYGKGKATPNLGQAGTPTAAPVLTTPAATIAASALPKALDTNINTKIMAAITSKNYAALEENMADSVVVRIESSGCCQPQNPQGAVNQLAYLNSATPPWIFNPTDPIIVQLAAKSPDYWGGNKIVGISSNKYGVAIGMDAQGNISVISMVVDYNLILNQ